MTNNYKAHSGQNVTVEDIVLETDAKNELVKRVKLKTNVGDITWRAKIYQAGYVEKGGFKIESKGSKKQPSIEELPEVIYALQRQLKEGPVQVKASYSEWTLSDVPKYSMNDRQFYAMQVQKTEVKKKK
jgi:phage-related protein